MSTFNQPRITIERIRVNLDPSFDIFLLKIHGDQAIWPIPIVSEEELKKHLVFAKALYTMADFEWQEPEIPHWSNTTLRQHSEPSENKQQSG